MIRRFTLLALMFLVIPFQPHSSFAIDLIQVVVENDLRVPGEAQIYFPFFRQKLDTDSKGIVHLPEAHTGLEIIEVYPKKPDLYGKIQRYVFPNDGIVSLRAIPVTQGIQAKAEHFKSNSEFAMAAVAYAVVSKRSNGYEARSFQKLAYSCLGEQYEIAKPYTLEGDVVKASPQLVIALKKSAPNINVPASGDFTIATFRAGASLKDLTPIVGDAQAKHFSEIGMGLNRAVTAK